MFWDSVSLLSELAVVIVKQKYPNEFKNPQYGQLVFDLVELVGDDLVKKNAAIFLDPFLSQLADIHDIGLGDSVDFVIAEGEGVTNE